MRRTEHPCVAAIDAVRRAVTLGGETKGSALAREILAEQIDVLGQMENALTIKGDLLAQDDEWREHQWAVRSIEAQRKQVAALQAAIDTLTPPKPRVPYTGPGIGLYGERS